MELRDRETPQALRDYEPVPFEYQGVFDLWRELSTCRPAPAVGLGGAVFLPLPVPVIEDHLLHRQVPPRSHDLVRFLHETMDRWWLEAMNAPRDDG